MTVRDLIDKLSEYDRTLNVIVANGVQEFEFDPSWFEIDGDTLVLQVEDAS